jgi:hypothetical protein
VPSSLVHSGRIARAAGALVAAAASILFMEGHKKAQSSPAAQAEAVRIQRLREDARRPISVNLAEGIALSHKLMRFTGAARKS